MYIDLRYGPTMVICVYFHHLVLVLVIFLMGLVGLLPELLFGLCMVSWGIVKVICVNEFIYFFLMAFSYFSLGTHHYRSGGIGIWSSGGIGIWSSTG